MSSDGPKTVSLVLGSGGARGLAHIGVIKWLESQNYEIKSISGCSIGALVGGIYACGQLDVFEEWAREINKIDVVRLLDISWGSDGLVEGDRIISTLKELIGDRSIEDLPIAYTAVAADLLTEKEVWLSRGSLFDAVRASISLPLFFKPFELNGMTLLDGGILNPVPIAPTVDDNTDVTIAVSLGGPPTETRDTASESEQAETAANHKETDISSKISNYIGELAEKYAKANAGSWKMLNIADRTFDAMQSTIARTKLASYPPDYIITIPRNACGNWDFDCADELIELGHNEAKNALAVLQ